MKKYIVEFAEKALIKRLIQCEVIADSEEEVEKKIKEGDYEFIDSWDDDELHSEFIEITDIEEEDED